ncbi:MAG: hypothetical protein U1E76_23075 [Planctomycetota bacterium]
MSYGVNNPYGSYGSCGPTGNVPFGAINWATANPIVTAFGWNQNVPFTGSATGASAFQPIATYYPVNATCGNPSGSYATPYGVRFNPAFTCMNPLNATLNPGIPAVPPGVSAGYAQTATPNAASVQGAPVGYGYGPAYGTFNAFPSFTPGFGYVNFVPSYGYVWNAASPIHYGWGSYQQGAAGNGNAYPTQSNPINAAYSAFTSSPFFNAASTWNAPAPATSYAPQSTVAPCSYTPSSSSSDANVEAFVPATAKGGPQGTLVHPHSGSFFHVPTGTFCHRPSGTILNIPSGVAMVGTGISGGSECMAKAASFFFAHPATQWINTTGTQWSLGEFFDYVSRS